MPLACSIRFEGSTWAVEAFLAPTAIQSPTGASTNNREARRHLGWGGSDDLPSDLGNRCRIGGKGTDQGREAFQQGLGVAYGHGRLLRLAGGDGSESTWGQ